MAGMVRKGMSWLGLGPEDSADRYDDEYDEYEDEDYEDEDEVEVAQTAKPTLRRRPSAVAAAPPSNSWEDNDTAGVTVLAANGVSRAVAAPVTDGPGRAVVRPLPRQSTSTPRVLAPTSFNDAQDIGLHVKKGRPVVVNLKAVDTELGQRLLDFASGVAFGVSGRVEKVGSRTYLLCPAGVDVSSEDRELLKRGDFSSFAD